MISSEMEAAGATRSLADHMSDFSYHHENDANHHNGSIEMSSHKVAKLTPAAFRSSKLGGGYRHQGTDSIINDANSVAITNKPSHSYRNSAFYTTQQSIVNPLNKQSKTLLQTQ